jgi:chromosome segregation ATPase
MEKIFFLLFQLIYCSKWLGLNEELKNDATYQQFGLLTLPFIQKLRTKLSQCSAQEEELHKKTDEITNLKQQMFYKDSANANLNLQIKNFINEIADRENNMKNKNEEIEHLERKISIQLENTNRMEIALKEKILDIEQINDTNSKLIQEISFIKALAQNQERQINDLITTNSNLSRELGNQEINKIKDERYTELSTEIEISRKEMSEIVRINESLRRQLVRETFQYNNDIQKRLSEKDELKRLINSNQRKFKPPVTYNNTDFWT